MSTYFQLVPTINTRAVRRHLLRQKNYATKSETSGTIKNIRISILHGRRGYRNDIILLNHYCIQGVQCWLGNFQFRRLLRGVLVYFRGYWIGCHSVEYTEQKKSWAAVVSIALSAILFAAAACMNGHIILQQSDWCDINAWQQLEKIASKTAYMWTQNSERIYLADNVQYIYIQKIHFKLSAGRSQLRYHKDR